MRPISVRIDNRVRVFGDLSEAAIREIQAEFTYKNPDFAKAKAFGFRARIPEYLRSWDRPKPTGNRFPVEVLSVPRGGYRRVEKILGDAGYTIEWEDGRAPGESEQIPQSSLIPRDYQKRLVDSAVMSMHNFDGVALWRSPQASGKTSAALMLAGRMHCRTLVIISNTVLFSQWQRRVREELGIVPGYIGGGKRQLDAPIVIAMQQSLKNVPDDDLAQFGLVIGDEVQLFAASTFQQSLDRIPAQYRLGISGDERRADHKEFLIYDQFGPVTAEVSHGELVEVGAIHEVEVRVVPSAFVSPTWDAIDRIEARPNETEAALRQRKIQRKIAMTEDLNDEIGKDRDRTQLVVGLAEECIRDAGQAIVLTTRREHCHILDAALVAAGYRSGLLIGGTDYREQFDRTLRLFKAGEIQVAVGTYQAIGVGFDLPIVARGVCAAPVANSPDGDKQWRQYRGRFARTADGKTDSAIYYVWDPAVYGLKPLRHLVRWNSNVVVRTATGWVPAKTWLKQHKDSNETTQRYDRDAGPHKSTPGFARWDSASQCGASRADRQAEGRSGTDSPDTPGGGLGVGATIVEAGRTANREASGEDGNDGRSVIGGANHRLRRRSEVHN